MPGGASPGPQPGSGPLPPPQAPPSQPGRGHPHPARMELAVLILHCYEVGQLTRAEGEHAARVRGAQPRVTGWWRGGKAGRQQRMVNLHGPADHVMGHTEA